MTDESEFLGKVEILLTKQTAHLMEDFEAIGDELAKISMKMDEHTKMLENITSMLNECTEFLKNTSSNLNSSTKIIKELSDAELAKKIKGLL